jgi:hypothetical protein
MHQRRLAGSHVVGLYQRVKRKQNHAEAAVAVARNLAEDACWILKQQQPYMAEQAHAEVEAEYMDSGVRR